ncbi:MAG: inositol monophosphatase family protein, partial [Polyangiaceae bacterium]
GLKGITVACGEADIYAHLGRAGFRWDACAPEAIVLGAGGMVTDAAGNPIDYRAQDLANEQGMIMSNGLLHAAVLAALR